MRETKFRKTQLKNKNNLPQKEKEFLLEGSMKFELCGFRSIFFSNLSGKCAKRLWIMYLRVTQDENSSEEQK